MKPKLNQLENNFKFNNLLSLAFISFLMKVYDSEGGWGGG